MGLPSDIENSDRVVKDDDISPPLQFPIMPSVTGNRNSIPLNGTLGVKSTVLDMVNRSEITARKEMNHEGKGRPKRNGSFWHSSCVLLLGVLINPAFGLAAVWLFSLEKCNARSNPSKQKGIFRRIGIGLMVTGIIVSLWIWSAVFIYHYAVYSVTRQFAGQPNYAGNKSGRNPTLPIGSSTSTGTRTQDLESNHLDTAGYLGSTDVLTRSTSTPTVSSLSQKNAVTHITLSPVLLRRKQMRCSTGTRSEELSTPDVVYPNALSSNVNYSREPSTANDSSTPVAGTVPDGMASTGKSVTAGIPEVTDTPLQHPIVLSSTQQTTKVLKILTIASTVLSTKTVESTTASSTSSKSDSPMETEEYINFLSTMNRFEGTKSVRGL